MLEPIGWHLRHGTANSWRRRSTEDTICGAHITIGVPPLRVAPAALERSRHEMAARPCELSRRRRNPTVDVRPSVNFFACRLLGTHVDRCANGGPGCR